MNLHRRFLQQTPGLAAIDTGIYTIHRDITDTRPQETLNE
jgi:hypothetical protein